MASVPLIVPIAGLPGAGKTTLAIALSERLGARTISRDQVRAALFDPCSLTIEEKMAAFDALVIGVRTNVALGHSTVVEGMPFSRSAEVDAMVAVARAAGAHCEILHLVVPADVAKERIARDRARLAPMADDRDPGLVDTVAARFDPIPSAHVLDGTLPPGELVDLAERHLSAACR